MRIIKKILSMLLSTLMVLPFIPKVAINCIKPRDPAVFYFDAENGSDFNDGCSEDSALKSIKILKYMLLIPGDKVLFHKGDTFRGHIRGANGVTYSSYGEGELPKILGSVDATDAAKWKQTKHENVWEFNKVLLHDAGNIIFNEGEKCGYKIAKGIAGREGSIEELTDDLYFFHDRTNGKVYLYSEQNPAERFESIEIATREHIIRLGSDSEIDGLKLMYGGAHAISGKNIHDSTVRNCEIGFIGGSVPPKRNRLGNGVELWESASDILVENCYIYQIYDAGLTFQSDNGNFTNITFRNNIVERCTYGLEYFNGDEGLFRNILIEGNTFRYQGYGWGKQRPDPGHTAAVNSWNSHINRFYNYKFVGNTFQGSTGALLIMRSTANKLPAMEGNKYMQYHYNCMFTPEFKFGSDASYEWLENTDPTGTMAICYDPRS